MPITPVAPLSGRQDTTNNHVSSSIRAPVFVDNAILHAKYTQSTDRVTGTTTVISPPSRNDFQYVHDKSYRLIETQDGVRLLHPHKGGMRYNGAVVFNGKKLDSVNDVPPMLIFGTEDTGKRLVPHSVNTDTSGTALPLANMQSRRLSDIEFEENVVRLGQTVSVGYRTTDGVQQLLKGALHSLNSFDVGFSFTGPRVGKNTLQKGADIKKHSLRFVAHDFYGVGIIQAMKYFGRYDNHTLYLDRFGNLMYAPHVFSITNRTLGDSKGVGEINNKPLLGVVNQIVSEGLTRGLNDDNRTIMDDLEMQKQIGSIKTTSIFNPLSRTPTASRRSGAEALRANKKAQRVVQSKSHINSWDLDPGDIVKYEAPSSGFVKHVAILNTSHNLRSQDSDFTMMTNEAGIESIIAMSESRKELESSGRAEDTSFLSSPIEMSNTGTTNIYITPHISTFHIGVSQPRVWSNENPPGAAPPMPTPFKPDDNSGVNRHAGIIIGHRENNGLITATASARGAIGVGGSYSTTSAAPIAAGVMTVGDTTRFPTSGSLIVECYSPESVLVTYTGKTPTTFTGCTPAVHPISTTARVIYARPRSHEMRMCRGQREVVM
jgi:hypothetical protein